MATASEKKNFIAKIAPLIQAEAKKRGYKTCAAVIAQACCEGNFGQSLLAKKYNNHFGLKCGSSWKGPSVNMKTKEEYTVGNLVSIRDNFRVFSSIEDGVKGYYDFVSTKRYERLRKVTTPREYAEALKAAGYATSSTYVNTLMSYINSYNLMKYDLEPISETNPYKLNVSLMKYGSRGESVKYLQYELNKHGANLKVDGIYGKQTELAVVLYQKDHKLVADGKAGPVTLLSLKNNQ